MSDSRIAEIVDKFCLQFPVELGQVGELVHQATSGEKILAEPARQRIYAEAHRLSGAADCIGFERVGQLLGQLELEFERPIGRRDWDVVSMRVIKLWRLIDDAARHIRPEQSAVQGRRPRGTAADADDPSAMAWDTKSTGLRGRSLLVVDDDLRIRVLVRDILATAGATEIALAGTGVEAVNCLAMGQPALIISDWNMPELDGLALLKRIRAGKTHARPDTPVLFLTTERNADRVRSAIVAGVDHFLVKPFTQHKLLEAVQRMLQGNDPSTAVRPASPAALAGY